MKLQVERFQRLVSKTKQKNTMKSSNIQIKNLDELKVMRRAGLLVRETLELVRDNIKAGITTSALDAIAEANIRRGGGTPN